MSDAHKSPNMKGLSGAEPLTSPTTNSSVSAGVSRTNMEVNATSTRVPDLNTALGTPAEKGDGKVFMGPYFPPNLMSGMTPPLVSQDIMSHQHLLTQMQMLSFYNQVQLLQQHQQKKMLADNENRVQKMFAEQERIEEQRVEMQRLSLIKQKPKEQESAIASDEVKQRLRAALMSKQRRTNVQSQGDISESVKRWNQRSQSSTSPPSVHTFGSSMSPPSTYQSAGAVQPHRGARDIEFPIRKTASEPNLKVKSMLKHKLGQDRRNSPLMSRRRQLDKLHQSPLSVETTGVNGIDQSAASPPVPLNLGSTPAISKEVQKAATKRSFEEALASRPKLPDNLYISMPNIPLGKTPNHQTNKVLTEADIRAKQAHQYGLPLTGHLYASPFQRSIAGITEEEYMHSLSAFSAMHDARRLAHPYLSKPPNLNASLDQQALNAQRHMRHQKPLSRTQSLPLPTMRPETAASLLLPPQQTLLEHQELVKQHHDQLQKQHQKKMVLGQLRQFLQRSSSKSHMEQVDEESEARIIQEMQESREDNYESQQQQQQRSVHSSHGSLYAATNAAAAAKSNSSNTEGLNANPAQSSSQSKRQTMRYLARTHSSPLVSFAPPPPSTSVDGETPINLATKASVDDSEATGVVYDEAMLRHHCPCQDNGLHLENPSRIQSIWSRLKSCGLVDRCRRVDSKKATIEQLQLCHTESYSIFFGVNSQNRQKLGLTMPELRFQRLNCGGIGVDADTVWNEETSPLAARMAVGSVIELSSKVYESQLKNGIAIVRPPGHHSESGQAMGFCFFNSVAIAAKHLKHKLGASKILILDWDVHHGNGTQQMTYDDPCILYISIHRHDNGMFFPGTGSITDCGEKQGLGFNVNIPFSGGLDPPMSDAEYMAAFRSIVMPIVKEFNPQITLVSAGFDGADGHANQLGGYKISPAGFGYMTKELMGACGNKVVLVLEGGYNLSSICDASEMCTRALLGDSVPLPNEQEILRLPSKQAIQTLEECSRVQAQFWPVVARHRSKICMSIVDALRWKDEPVNETNSMKTEGTTTKSSNSTAPTASTEPMEES